jgi:hypothetical protein
MGLPRSNDALGRAPLAYTVVLCEGAGCGEPDGVTIKSTLAATVRLCPHAVLVVAGCPHRRGRTAQCPAFAGRHGAMVIVQRCSPGDRKPLGSAVSFVVRTQADLAAVCERLSRRDLEAEDSRTSRRQRGYLN